MNLLASTLGQWAETYRLIIDAKPIICKTKANRRSSLAHVLDSWRDVLLPGLIPCAASRKL